MRVSEDEIAEAYAETAYRPQSQSWINTITMECDPLTVLIMARESVSAVKLERELATKSPWAGVCQVGRYLGLSPSYVLGFSTGFDGAEQAYVIDQFADKNLDCDDFVEGYQDGQNINAGP